MKNQRYPFLKSVVGKLVSLDCAVLPGMWYARNQYATMQASKVKPDDTKASKWSHFIVVIFSSFKKVCKIDNQALKAVLEKKGTSHNFFLNQVGKNIFWLTETGQFHLSLEYVKSEENISDPFTRQSPGLESSLS